MPIMITDTKSNFAKAELKKKLKISMKSFFFSFATCELESLGLAGKIKHGVLAASSCTSVP